jgi:hypothetical protein
MQKFKQPPYFLVSTSIPLSTPLHSPQLASIHDITHPTPPLLSNDHMDALGSLPVEYALEDLQGTPPGYSVPFVPPPSMQPTQTG